MNCATTNQYFVNEKRLLKNGVMMKLWVEFLVPSTKGAIMPVAFGRVRTDFRRQMWDIHRNGLKRKRSWRAAERKPAKIFSLRSTKSPFESDMTEIMMTYDVMYEWILVISNYAN